MGFSRAYEQAVQLIKQAVLGELAPISHPFPLKRKVSGYKLQFLKAYQAGDFRVQVWSVKQGNATLIPQEKEFYNCGDLALCLKPEGLNKEEKLLLYVLIKR